MGVHKLGKLDKPMLKVLMEPYRGTDIDSGGAADLKDKDGLEVPDIVIKIMAPDVFKKLEPLRLKVKKHPKNWDKLTEKQQDEQSDYYDKRCSAFNKITEKNFGW